MQTIATAFVVGEAGRSQLALTADEVVAYKAKRTLFRQLRATGEVSASKRREEITSAAVDKETGTLEIAFADGTSWRFEVPPDELAGVQQIVAELAASGPV